MGWIGDTVKALLGFDDEERAFRDSLANAERYVDWGGKGGNPTDLQHALKLLAGCRVEEAPNAHYAYRRDRAAAEAHARLAVQAIDILRAKTQKLEEHFEKVEEGRKSLVSQTEVLRGRVAELEAEGSLISAREERRRLEEMERDVRELPDVVEERVVQIQEALEESAPRYRRHREGAARSIAALKELKGLTPEDREICDTIVGRIEKNLAAVDEGWKTLSDDLQKSLGPAGESKPPEEKPAAG
jgi:hypothetical protein